MLNLGSLTLNGTPRVAVGFNDKIQSIAIKKGLSKGIDIAEIRIDQFSSYKHEYVLEELKQYKGIPTIATIRLKSEGGGWCLSEEERLSLFKVVIPHVDAVDIELQATAILHEVIGAAQEADKLAVVSYHNFEETPPVSELTALIDEAKSIGADIVKIAAQVQGKQDVQDLARVTLENAAKNIIIIGMGSEGLVTRFFFPALGSLITFAYVGRPTAPGQLHFDDAFDLLRTLYPSFNQEKFVSLELVENF